MRQIPKDILRRNRRIQWRLEPVEVMAPAEEHDDDPRGTETVHVGHDTSLDGGAPETDRAPLEHRPQGVKQRPSPAYLGPDEAVML